MSAMDVEELSVTFEDVQNALSQPVLESRVEDIVQEELNFREAFRSYDATNISTNVVEIPVPDDAMGQPKVVEEGAEFPRDQESYTKKQLTFQKFGFEVPITMEAQEDTQANLVDDQVDRQAREMREEMNSQAWDAINNAVSTTRGNANGTMEFQDLLGGREYLLNNSYDPDLLVVDVPGSHDLQQGSNLFEATDAQSQLRRSGQIGQIGGLDVIEDDSSINITGNSNPGALMIDTDYFGYEGERDPITAEEYEERRSQTDVFRLFTRMGWLVTESNAGVIVEG